MRTFRPVYLGAAAGLLLACGGNRAGAFGIKSEVNIVVSADENYSEGDVIEEGGTIETSEEGGVEAVLPDGTSLEIAPSSEVVVEEVRNRDGDWSARLRLGRGGLRMEVTHGTDLNVYTPVAVAGVRGTDFGVEFDSDSQEAAVQVFEGQVAVEADGETGLLGPEEEARASRAVGMRRSALAEEARLRWEERRSIIADHLMERFGIEIEGDTPDLREVLSRLPEGVRERVRGRLNERLNRRRGELREALERRGVTIDPSLPLRERLRRAREAFEEMDPGERREMRRAFIMERLGRRREELRERLGTTGERSSGDSGRSGIAPPNIDVRVSPPLEGDGARPRPLVRRPVPPMRPDNPTRTSAIRLVVEVEVGPQGAIRSSRLIESSGNAEIDRAFVRLVRAWRFAPSTAARGLETRRLTISTIPD